MEDPVDFDDPTSRVTLFQRFVQNGFYVGAPTVVVQCDKVMKTSLFLEMQVGCIAGVITTPIFSRALKTPLIQAWKAVLPTSAALCTVVSAGVGYNSYLRRRLLREDLEFSLAASLTDSKLDEFAWIGACAGGSVGGIIGRAVSMNGLFSAGWLAAGSLTGVAVGVTVYGIKAVLLPRSTSAGSRCHS